MTTPMTQARSTGRVWRLPADVTTDALAPGRFMSGGLEGLAPHCLSALRPGFAQQVRPGDILAAGPNFGAGSSREQAAGVLRHLGVAAVLAPSFAGLFYRNAINLGLPVLICAQAEQLVDGDTVCLDWDQAEVQRLDAARHDNPSLTTHSPLALPFERPAPFLQQMLDAGGLLPMLRERVARGD